MPGRKVIDIDYERELRKGEVEAESEYDRPHGFWVQTEDGLVGHINGDPRMSDETLEVIIEVMRLAYSQFLRERSEGKHETR